MTEGVSSPTFRIGVASRESGIPASTLRTWERRYGFPNPNRNGAGHRVYDFETVDRLRLTRRAIDAGFRPSNVVGMGADELRRLLELREEAGPNSSGEANAVSAPGGADRRDGWIARWLDAARRLDGSTLTRDFRNDWNRLGGLEFLGCRAAPFLRAVGEKWAAGDLQIVHEHYASELLRDFLGSRWRPHSSRSVGPTALLATPEAERHGLGLHMSACALAIAGWQIAFLGVDTPLSDIAGATASVDASAVAISIASSYREDRADSFLVRLRAELPAAVELVAGGDGAPSNGADLRSFDDLEEFYEWAEGRAR